MWSLDIASLTRWHLRNRCDLHACIHVPCVWFCNLCELGTHQNFLSVIGEAPHTRDNPDFQLIAQTMQKRPVQISRGTEMVFEVFAVLIVHVHVFCPSNNNNSGFIWRTYPSRWRCSRRLCYHYPGYSPGTLVAHSAFEGTYSCWVPIYYTWVERENCG